MDADQIRALRPKLRKFLKAFDDCFLRSDTRGHLPVYVAGQLSDLPRKNCEPIADAQGIPPRTLQQFLSLLAWDHGLMKTKLQRLIAAEHAGARDSRPWCNAAGRFARCADCWSKSQSCATNRGKPGA